jgi:hypothetical protein
MIWMENHGGMMSTGKFLIRPPELSGNATSSHQVASRRNGEGNDELAKYICSYLLVIFLRGVRSSDVGHPVLLLLRRKVCCGSPR